jgi:hypothetical protein
MNESEFPKFPEFSNTAQQFKIVALHYAIKFMCSDETFTGMTNGKDIENTVTVAKKFEEYLLNKWD